MNLNTCVEVFSLYAPTPPQDWDSDEWILANRLTKYLVIIVGLLLMLINSVSENLISIKKKYNKPIPRNSMCLFRYALETTGKSSSSKIMSFFRNPTLS